MGLLLMDVGKIRLPKALLTKSTPLTEDEMIVMRKHVAYSVDILRKSEGFSEHIINIALTHHERYDGSGYPNGLIGTQTPAYGRMAAIIDCYDAMITSTPYRQAISEHKALQNLFDLSGKLFPGRTGRTVYTVYGGISDGFPGRAFFRGRRCNPVAEPPSEDEAENSPADG